MREVVIVSGARTAVGTFQGTLKTIPAAQLGAVAVEVDECGQIGRAHV